MTPRRAKTRRQRAAGPGFGSAPCRKRQRATLTRPDRIDSQSGECLPCRLHEDPPPAALGAPPWPPALSMRPRTRVSRGARLERPCRTRGSLVTLPLPLGHSMPRSVVPIKCTELSNSSHGMFVRGAFYFFNA